MSEEEKRAITYFYNETLSEEMHYGGVLVKLVEKQQEQLQEKDKIIDLMAINLINAPIRIIKGDIFKFTNKEDTIEYFTNKVREV